jgi:hypothetical protein
MTERSEVHHINDDSKYRVSYEQSATKGILGFKVESHGNDLMQCHLDAVELLEKAYKQSKIYSENKEG